MNMETIIQSQRENHKLIEALRLARAKVRIFPVSKDKKPLIKDWPNVSTTDESQIIVWFDVPDPPNIGVLTGHQAGLFVLDVDGPEGLASLEAFEREYGVIGRTCEVRTPSGGLHLYFKTPAFELRNSAGKLGLGLDIRASGGYIIVPCSQVLNRFNLLAPYEYISKCKLGEIELHEAPPWLLVILRSLAQPSQAAAPVCLSSMTGVVSLYGLKALRAECDKIRATTQGSRNDTLNRSAFALFQLVAGGALDANEVESDLTAAAEDCGLTLKEIQATLKSASEKAMQSPRSVPKACFYGENHLPPPPEECTPPDIFHLPHPPIDVFPPIIKKMILDTSKVFGDLPLEVPVVALFALLSGCVGQSVEVEVKRGWQVAGNFYWGIVAPSGLGKSPCANAFMQPLWRLDKKNKDQWDEDMMAYNAILEERRNMKDSTSPPPTAPLLAQYIVDDATIEAVGRLLAENPRGLIWVCDELAMLFQNLERYSNSRGGSISRLLSSYDRASWKINRRERDKDQVVLSAALSIFGTIQPRTLKSVFSQSDADNGLLPRFAFILAKRSLPPLLNEEEFSGGPLLKQIAAHILSWPMIEHEGQPAPQKIKLTNEAYGQYKTWRNDITESTWQTSEIDKLIVPKLVGMVPRLALLLTALDAALDEKFCSPEIGLGTMRAAIKFGDWIYQHQKHIWLSMGLENELVKTPLDEAIMRTALGLWEYLKVNDWRVLNDDFNGLVASTMAQDAPVNQIGKAAIKLGIKNVTIGKKRGKEFSQELLDKFRVSFYL